MNKHDKERHEQHDPHGLVKSTMTSQYQPGRELWKCPCGWSGWLLSEDNDG